MSKYTSRNLKAETPEPKPISERYSLDAIIAALQKSEPEAIPLALEWMRAVLIDVRLDSESRDRTWRCTIWPDTQADYRAPLSSGDIVLTTTILCCLLKYQGWLRKIGDMNVSA